MPWLSYHVEVRFLSRRRGDSLPENTRGNSNVVKALGAALLAILIFVIWEVVTAHFASLARSPVDEILLGAALAFLLSLIFLHRRDIAALMRERENFNNLVEHVPGLTCIVDTNRKLVRWNTRFQQMLGYSAEELSNIEATETIAQQYRELVPEVMGAAWTDGHAEMEAAWLTKAGKAIPCYLTAVRIFDRGQPFVLSVGIDISERKRAEEAVLKSEVEYRRLLANIPDVTWTMNAERKITYVSPNVEDVFGYTSAEVLAGGLELRNARTHPDDLPLVLESQRALFVAGRPLDVEYRMRRKDDRWIWIHNRSVRTFEQDGMLFADGILSDVTEQKRAERVNSQLASIVNSSIAAIIGTTADGTIVSWNPGAETTFGYAAAEAIGKHISMLVAPEKLHEVPEVIAKVMRGEPIPPFESVAVRKDGVRIDISLAISGITDKTGRVFGTSTIANDISAQKEAEKVLLRAKEAAEAAMHAKSEFLANISHELRTPMNGILGMAELALDTALDAEQREYLLTLQSSGSALLDLINKLLDFTRTESGPLTLQCVSFKFREILKQTIRPFFFQAQQVGLEILCHVDPDLPEIVVGDLERLRKVLVNLVGNAIKFTHQGRVVVRVNCNLRTEDNVEFLFAISDTGIGIPAAKHAAIFEPFTQSDGSTTRKYGGSGLGLSVSKRLVELMGGKIWVESEPGLGSTFYFTVPFGLPVESAVLQEQSSRT